MSKDEPIIVKGLLISSGSLAGRIQFSEESLKSVADQLKLKNLPEIRHVSQIDFKGVEIEMHVMNPDELIPEESSVNISMSKDFSPIPEGLVQAMRMMNDAHVLKTEQALSPSMTIKELAHYATMMQAGINTWPEEQIIMTLASMRRCLDNIEKEHLQ